MTKDTPIYVASITMVYTAMAVMRLVKKGVLPLDDPMSRYLPERNHVLRIARIHCWAGERVKSKRFFSWIFLEQRKQRTVKSIRPTDKP